MYIPILWLVSYSAISGCHPLGTNLEVKNVTCCLLSAEKTTLQRIVQQVVVYLMNVVISKIMHRDWFTKVLLAVLDYNGC